MKKFDEHTVLLQEMMQDSYFPKFLVEKLKNYIQETIEYLETGETDTAKIQKKFDAMTMSINKLQDEFEENGSEIETVARDSIGKTVESILNWFEIDMDAETALRKRDW